MTDSLILQQELTGRLNAPVVYSHNDLLSGNLMLNDDEGIYNPYNFTTHAPLLSY